MSKTIEQTRDLVLFGIQLSTIIRADLEDGKMSIFEILGLIKLIGPAQTAIEGIEQVPGELLDLDSEEAKEIFDAIREAVGSNLDDERARAIAKDSLDGVQSLLSAIASIRNINPVPAL